MEVETALRGRRSIRRYLPDPLGDELLRPILDEARWSPSWANSQPWSVWVVRGAALERLRSGLRERVRADAPSAPDLTMPSRQWPDRISLRIQSLRGSMSALAAPVESGASSADLFGAPCLIVVGIDEGVPVEYPCFDAGLFVQSLCLAAQARGLGTCIMAMAVRHPDLLREILPGTAGKRFVVGVALGRPDPTAPINSFDRQRAGLDELVAWVDETVPRRVPV